MQRENIHNQMADLADLTLLDWLINGKPIVDAKGNPVKNKQGEQGRRPLSDREMDRVLKRLGQVGVVGRVIESAGAEALARHAEERIKSGEIKFNGKPIAHSLPPLSQDDDAATRRA